MRFRLAIALLLAWAITAVIYARLPGNRQTGVFDTNPPTPYFHYKPIGTPRGRLLVVHGLNSSKSVMNVFSYSLADAGFEVFSIDLPGHGESRAAFNAVRTASVVGGVLDKLGPLTAVVGHSFGAATLLDLANERSFERMVLFSPAPEPLQTVHAEHVLVLQGQFDPPGIRAFTPQIRDVATGTFELRDLAWTGHTSALFKPRVTASVAEWLGGDGTAIRTTARLALLLLLLALSLALGGALLAAIPPMQTIEARQLLPAHLCILYYTVAAFASIGVLAVVGLAKWLNVFAMDYLVGLFFLTGAILLSRCKGVSVKGRGLLPAIAAAAYLIVVTGRFGLSELFHAVATGQRWWRALAIFALSLPMFLADEYLLRPIQPARKAAVLAILTRIILWAVTITGALILNRQSSFLLLVTHFAVFLWIGLWFAAAAIRRRSSPFAAACFAAMVQGWFFAALFILV